MKRQIPLVLGLGLLATGCELDDQDSPFGTSQDPVTREISSSGGVISSPAGASVTFPEGALSSSQSVTLTPQSVSADFNASGEPVSSLSFALEPRGLDLARPALAELRFDPGQSGSAWLASVVNLTPEGTQEHGDTRVDLSTGIVSAPLTTLGTLAVVLPEAEAVFPVTPTTRTASFASIETSASFGAATFDSVAVRCGDPDNRCTEIEATASQNLLDMVEDVALVYPLIDGVLQVDASNRASGQLTLNASFRVQLESGATAENVEIRALVEPTAQTTVSESSTHVAFSNMRFFIAGSGEGGQSGSREVIADLVLPKDSSQRLITLTRSFQIRSSGGQTEEASVSVTFPVEIYQ